MCREPRSFCPLIRDVAAGISRAKINLLIKSFAEEIYIPDTVAVAYTYQRIKFDIPALFKTPVGGGSK